MFSIVIPTHNGLDALKDALDTVLDQSYEDFEIIIFDNCSSDKTEDYIRDLPSKKIVYRRSDIFLAVTESWNHAIEYATGKYITLIGNDDGLIPDYFKKLSKIIHDFNYPEMIYSGIYHYIGPGVMPGNRDGYTTIEKNGFFFEKNENAFLLSKDKALKAVRGSLSMKRNFGYNVQSQCYKSSFLHRIRKNGIIYHSPFPDYYLANVAFAQAKSLVVVPEPLAIQGTSKKSFGYTLFNGLEDQGEAYLNNKNLSSDPHYNEFKDQLLQGSSYQTNFIVTMVHVVDSLKNILREKVNFKRYRRYLIFKRIFARQNKIHYAYIFNDLKLKEKGWAIFLQAVFLLNKHLKKNYLKAYLAELEPYDFQPQIQIICQGLHSRLIDFYHYLKDASKK